MKTVEVELTGVTPLLMNSPKSMLEPNKGTKLKTKKYDQEEDAEKGAYRTDSGELYVPAEAIKACIVGAAAYRKFGKYAARPIVAGGVYITPRQIELGTKDYDIDLRTVVIQRSRVVKARPRLDEWKIKFTLKYNENLIADDSLLRPIFEDAGQRVGLLDFRPQKLGEFGQFEVTKWQPKD